MKVSVALPLIAAAALAGCTQPYDDYGDPYGYPPAPPPSGQYPGGYDGYGGYGYDEPTQVMDPYRAVGTEPFWSLDINPQSMRFQAMDGRAIVEDTPQAQQNYGGDYYRGRRIEVNIVHQSCSDGMSDRVYPDQVQVRVDGREWRGCGAPARSFNTDWDGGTAPGYDRDPYDSGAGYGDGYSSAGMLARTNWRVVRLNGAATPASGYYLNFLPDRLQAKFGCNDLSASYREQRGDLVVDQIASTRMACPDIASETRGSNILAVPMRVRLEGDTLFLSNDRGTIEARRAG